MLPLGRTPRLPQFGQSGVWPPFVRHAARRAASKFIYQAGALLVTLEKIQDHVRQSGGRHYAKAKPDWMDFGLSRHSWAGLRGG